ncbi:MAG: V-type ATPase 116kDa subunit family protein [Candidatus Bathyarchaeia archaeon]
MKKVRAIVHGEYLDDVLKALGELGTFHFIVESEERLLLEKDGLLKPMEASKLLPRASSLLARTEKLLSQLGFSEETFLKAQGSSVIGPLEKGFEDFLERVEGRITFIESEYSRLSDIAPSDDAAAEDLRKLVKEGGLELFEILETLRLGRQFEEMKLAILGTERCRFFEGWVPAGEDEEIVKAIERASEGFCIVEVEEPSHHDTPPSTIRLPSLLKTFEALTRSYGTPSYHELNPSIFMAITFPIVFGLMFADVGHGLLLIILGALALALSRRMPKPGEMLGYILNNGFFLITLGLCAIIGGFLFGEFFGFHDIIHPMGFKLVVGRTEIPIGGFNPVEALKHGELMPMFKFSILIGAIHISIGLIVNLLTKLINRELKEAFFESLCWLWFYVGLIYSLFTYKFELLTVFIGLKLPDFLYLIVAIFLPLILMLLGKGRMEGFMEGFSFTFEAFVSSLGNTVSYGRLMALLLSHAMMSSMFITLVEGQSMAMQALSLILGTILVMALEGLIIFVHTTRLHWVEWFSKFYKGDGIEYKPFRIAVGSR